MAPVMSANVFRSRVTLPVVVPCGLTNTVYVPVAGKVKESMNPVLPLQIPVEAREVPSDFNTLTTTALQPTYVLPLRFMLNCWPDVPLNVYNAFCPAVVVVVVSDVPTLMVPVTSANVFSSRVMLPVVVPCGLTSTVYVPVAGTRSEEHTSELQSHL